MPVPALLLAFGKWVGPLMPKPSGYLGDYTKTVTMRYRKQLTQGLNQRPQGDNWQNSHKDAVCSWLDNKWLPPFTNSNRHGPGNIHGFIEDGKSYRSWTQNVRCEDNSASNLTALSPIKVKQPGALLEQLSSWQRQLAPRVAHTWYRMQGGVLSIGV